MASVFELQSSLSAPGHPGKEKEVATNGAKKEK
jgi:hypothetical protein